MSSIAIVCQVYVNFWSILLEDLPKTFTKICDFVSGSSNLYREIHARFGVFFRYAQEAARARTRKNSTFFSVKSRWHSNTALNSDKTSNTTVDFVEFDAWICVYFVHVYDRFIIITFCTRVEQVLEGWWWGEFTSRHSQFSISTSSLLFLESSPRLTFYTQLRSSKHLTRGQSRVKIWKPSSRYLYVKVLFDSR